VFASHLSSIEYCCARSHLRLWQVALLGRFHTLLLATVAGRCISCAVDSRPKAARAANATQRRRVLGQGEGDKDRGRRGGQAPAVAGAGAGAGAGADAGSIVDGCGEQARHYIVAPLLQAEAEAEGPGSSSGLANRWGASFH